jgi:hypothetical protein
VKTIIEPLRIKSVEPLRHTGGAFVALSPGDFARAEDNKDWLVEFPPGALRIISRYTRRNGNSVSVVAVFRLLTSVFWLPYPAGISRAQPLAI